MNISDLLGAMVQSGMSPSSHERMKKSLGSGGLLENLAGMAGGASAQSGNGGMADMLSKTLGSGKGGGADIGDLLSNMLGGAGKAVGGNRNLAAGGLGALVGSLLGGGKKSVGGSVGGGLMALLGAMAYNALKAGGTQKPQVPVGLVEPRTDDEQKQLEYGSDLVLRAMINATKADGQIDQSEVNRILGKYDTIGIDPEGRQYLQAQFRRPMETEKIVAEIGKQPELAAQVYAASLLAIEVDTPAEKRYLDQLAAGLGLPPQVTARIQQLVGLQQA
jgi:uncharacterized membrane protein YebE (DUF533 family)